LLVSRKKKDKEERKEENRRIKSYNSDSFRCFKLVQALVPAIAALCGNE